MKIAVRMFSGEKRLYEIDDPSLSIEEVKRIISENVPMAKTILIECINRDIRSDNPLEVA